MPIILALLLSPLSLVSAAPTTPIDQVGRDNGDSFGVKNVQLGDRPYYLINNMTEGPLKTKLESCRENDFKPTRFSISHRGAPLQYPEHTIEGLVAAHRQGSGVIECDISFTSDRQLVCRHSNCDLQQTTDILLHPELAAKCTEPFTPATDNGTAASAKCCTSDITLAEFKTLCGKQDGFNASATNVQDFQNGAPSWRTTLYDTCGTLMTLGEFIDFGKDRGLDFTPELKKPEVEMPFEGNYTQEAYAQQAIDEFKNAGVSADRVWAQSFYLPDVLYWIKAEPAFGRQAVYLDERTDNATTLIEATKLSSMQNLTSLGVKIIAPSLAYLLRVDNATNTLEPSEYAVNAKQAGLKIIAWSLERSGPLMQAAEKEDYYISTIASYANFDGAVYEIVHALAQRVKVLGIFSDWPSTVSFYADCFGLQGGFRDEDRN